MFFLCLWCVKNSFFLLFLYFAFKITKKENIMKKKLAFCIASLFGIGFAPVASGTFGSFATVWVAAPLCYYFGFCGVFWAVIVATVIGTLATKEVLKYTKHDPSLVVVDEFAGQMLTFVATANMLRGQCHWKAALWYLIGFGLFRVFDITKPWIVGWADKKLLNAWGVMLDDIFAGAFASVCLYALMYLF